MKKCHNCGNTYDKCFDVTMDGKSYIFDSFECAINKLAPACNNCNSKIIGHGVEVSNTYYCCANCAKEKGASNLKDRV